MEQLTLKRLLSHVVILPLIILLAMTGAFWVGLKYGEKRDIANRRGNIVRVGLQKYTNQLLLCDISPDDQTFTEFKSLKTNLEKIINEQTKNGVINRISIYVRALNSGRWADINENEKFIPASLLKVPMMMSYLKEVDENPNLLDKKLVYNAKFDDLVRKFGSEPSLTGGTAYSIDDLLEKMIVKSDNTPLFLLSQYMSQDVYNNLFTELQIALPSNPSNVEDVDFLSAKDFSKFFRVLYSASYLSPDMSNKALDLLARADFPEGIKSGIPAGTMVADKFGARIMPPAADKQPVAQLHDCGIVYYPDHPYFLCVMTEGGDFTKLTSIIHNVSTVTYSQMVNLYKPDQIK